MFTGIVKELGSVRRVERAAELYKLEISCPATYDGSEIGDSVSVNGVCLTVTAKSRGILQFDIMEETIRRTTLAGLKNGDTVNLEPSLKTGGSLDGHFVLGHIDCIGTVRSIVRQGDRFVMVLNFPEEHSRLVVEKGSVAIDGISLTVGETDGGRFTVYLIPHTLKMTTLDSRRAGDRVNLEFDIIGKYIAKMAGSHRSGITEEFLKANGF